MRNVHEESTRPGDGGPLMIAGRYALVAMIGTGGMGRVYRVHDRELDEEVALKMLRRELLEIPGIVERFRAEVKLQRKVASVHVARMFDIGEHEGDKFLTMELVDGESLEEVCTREGQLSFDFVARIGTAVCRGLAAAHAAGVVHCDLKPGNVLLSKDGGVKITDFGIARALSGPSPAALSNAASPAYMAPEQVGSDEPIDARADLYAFGAMLYEMITGDLPWHGDTPFAMAAVRLFGPSPSPLRLRPDTPPELVDVVQKCMQREPERRFASAVELEHALARVGTPDGPRGPSTRRMRAAAVASACNVAVLPFRNSGPREDEILADALMDEVIDNLAMSKELRVRSRGAVVGFKGLDVDPQQLGKQLGVDVVVEGSLARTGADLSATIRLVSVEDGFQVAAQKLVAPPSELLSLGQRLAAAATAALCAAPAPRAAGLGGDAETLALYLRAKRDYQLIAPEASARAVQLFREALRRVPDEPLLLAAYATSLVRASFFAASDVSAAEMLFVAERAVARAPRLPEARLALATLRLQEQDGPRAAVEVRAALDLSPSSAEAHALLGRMCLEIGDLARGLTHLELARGLDPSLVVAASDQARAYALMGDWPSCERVVGQAPEGAERQRVFFSLATRIMTWRYDSARAKELCARVAASPVAAERRMAFMLELLTKRLMTREHLDVLAAGYRDTTATPRRRAFAAQVACERLAFAHRWPEALAALTAADEVGLLDLGWLDRCPLVLPMREHATYREIHARVGTRAARLRAALDAA